jgi:hypothetical protein
MGKTCDAPAVEKCTLNLKINSEARESRAKVVHRIAAVAARHPVLARSFSFPVMI